MASPITLSCSSEFIAAGNAIGALIGDLVAKKTVAQISGDVLPQALAAVGGSTNISTDIKAIDNQIYLLRCILLAVEANAPAAL